MSQTITVAANRKTIASAKTRAWALDGGVRT